MSQKKIFGIITYGAGLTIFICDLIFIFSVFLGYFSKKKNFAHDLLFFFLGEKFFPKFDVIASEITVFIISLFLVYIGCRLSPSIRIKGVVITMFTLGLFSILLGGSYIFFPLNLGPLIITILVLILVAGFVYLIGGFNLLKLKDWARRLTIYYSGLLVFWFFPISIYLLPTTPLGGGAVLATAFSAYIVVPLFFIIFLTRPHIKELFRKS